MIKEIGSYDQIDELLNMIQLLLKQQMDSIDRQRGIEPSLTRNERASLIKELLAHLQYLRQVREEASPKRRDGLGHHMPWKRKTAFWIS
jgi:hypothetical protein